MKEIGNWQIATDTLTAISKAQRQNFPWGFLHIIHSVQSTK